MDVNPMFGERIIPLLPRKVFNTRQIEGLPCALSHHRRRPPGYCCHDSECR